jgi:phage shock protein A
LSLKRFKWSEKYFPTIDDRNSIGFIAQEVEQYFPNAVKTHKNKFLLQKGETEEDNIYEEFEDFKSLDIDQLIKCLFGSVKYLQNQVKTLQQKNETLEQKNETLEQRISNLESKIL